MQNGENEAFSRVLIDKALEFSGWNLLDPHQVRFELNVTTGRADYVLSGHRGPLSVLEAKREDLDPYDAKEKSRGYAENLKAPFIILSNGREHWFWNYTRPDQDAYRIERLPSLADLERLRLKNLQPPRPLMSEIITRDYLKKFRPDLSVRRYQLEDFNVILAEYKPVLYKTARRRPGELLGSSVVVATLQSLMVVFEALRQSSLVRQSSLAGSLAA